MDKVNIDYLLSRLNADSAFDVKKFMETVEQQYKITPNIPENKRNKKEKSFIRYFSEHFIKFGLK